MNNARSMGAPFKTPPIYRHSGIIYDAPAELGNNLPVKELLYSSRSPVYLSVDCDARTLQRRGPVRVFPIRVGV